jgi:hypothetical protein
VKTTRSRPPSRREQDSIATLRLFNRQVGIRTLLNRGLEISVPLRPRAVLPPLIDLGEHAPDEGAQIGEGLNVARQPASCASSVARPTMVLRWDGSVIAQSA